MPKKLERCATKVGKTGKSKSSAYAICTASLKKGKKKKKRFVEMVFDPDSGVTIVKRKRKRGDGLGDEWEF